MAGGDRRGVGGEKGKEEEKKEKVKERRRPGGMLERGRRQSGDGEKEEDRDEGEHQLSSSYQRKEGSSEVNSKGGRGEESGERW